MKNEKTVQALFNLWFWNFQNTSMQQFSNLYHATRAIIKFFNENKKYDAVLDDLRKLYFHPIPELRSRYLELEISKNAIDWDVNKMEWCYFRDTHYRSKLSREYFVDSRKVQETKKIRLGEVITVLSLFKEELYNVIVQIMVENNLSIYISLPTGTKEIEQLRDSDMVA